MSFISKVKCGRCDRSYSGRSLKCPYCGASRSRGGKRSVEFGDAAARRMIKVLLLLVLVVTVVSMAVIDFSIDPAEGSGPIIVPGQDTGEGDKNGENEEDNGTDTAALPGVLPGTEQAEPEIEVTNIDIEWRAKREGVNDMALRIGDELELWAALWPSDTDAEVFWETDDHLVANFTIHSDDHRRITLEARGTGKTLLRAIAGEESAEVIVRVR